MTILLKIFIRSKQSVQSWIRISSDLVYKNKRWSGKNSCFWIMARVDLRLLLVFLMVVAVVSSAGNATTAAPATTAATTTPAPPKTPGILKTIENFVAAIPVGLATACEAGAEAVKSFFTNPWW